LAHNEWPSGFIRGDFFKFVVLGISRAGRVSLSSALFKLDGVCNPVRNVFDLKPEEQVANLLQLKKIWGQTSEVSKTSEVFLFFDVLEKSDFLIN